MARKVVPEKVEEAKEKIIIATMDLIVQEGFSKLTLANVAERAGITKAAIYWYFSNKDELINSMTSSLKETFIDDTKKIALLPISPKEKIEAYFCALENIEIRNKCFFLIKAFVELCYTNDEARTIIQSGYREYTEILQEVFDEAINGGELKTEIPSSILTKILVATIDGCVVHAEMFGVDWIDLKEVRHFYMSLV